MNQDKGQNEEKMHRNSCPISVSRRGDWAASVPPECNCFPPPRKEFGYSEINRQIVLLFLQKLELLTPTERGTIRNVIELIAQPVFVTGIQRDEKQKSKNKEWVL